jgi:6-phosphogluconolactonase (cycloisomerase 2 family)
MTGYKISRIVPLLTFAATLACAGAANAGDGSTVYVIGDADIGGFSSKTGAAISGSPFSSLSCPDLGAVKKSKLLFVPDSCNSNIRVFSINNKTDALSEVSGSPFPASSDLQQPVVTPSGKFLYIAEDVPGDVVGFRIGKNGALTPLASSPFPAGGADEGLVMHPSGKFLYAIDGLDTPPNSVTAFKINEKTGALTQITGSPFPVSDGIKFAAITPSGKYLYITEPGAEPTQMVVGFKVNEKTGALTDVAGSPFPTGPNPTGITTDGNFVYVADNGSSEDPTPGDVSGFKINEKTGALTPVAGSPFTAGANPKQLAIDPSEKLLVVTNEDEDDMSIFKINQKTGVLTPVSGSPFPTNIGSEGVVFAR